MVTEVEIGNRVGIYLDDGDLFVQAIEDTSSRAYIDLAEGAVGKFAIGSRARSKRCAVPQTTTEDTLSEIERVSTKSPSAASFQLSWSCQTHGPDFSQLKRANGSNHIERGKEPLSATPIF